MKIFKLDDMYSVVCVFKGTRSGFKYTATLMKNGLQVAETKICYLNRTWERFEYESVLIKLIDNNFSGSENEIYKYAVKDLN